MEPEVFLDYKNERNFRDFERILEQKLQMLISAPDPEKLQAKSLADPRLGRAIIQRKKDTAGFICMLVAYEERNKTRQAIQPGAP